MRRFFAIAAVALVAFGAAGSALAGPWTPGTNYLVSEEDAASYLENRFDRAYCDGIPRYGHRGEFPDEEFVVFECDVQRSDRDIDCSGVRLKAVKGHRRGYFRLTMMPSAAQRGAYCY